MTVTFHGFPSLPKELREHIWDMVIYQTNRPGAHVFKIGEEQRQSVLVPLSWQQGQHEDIRPLKSDWSSYLPYGELWTVCSESRARIQDFHAKAARLVRPQDHRHAPNVCLNPLIFTCSRSIGDKQNCVVYPERDLICIRPHNFDVLEGRWLTLLDGSVQGATACCRSGIQNLSLEIDESFSLPVSVDISCAWGGPGDGGLLGSIARAMISLPNRKVHKLWVIDYRITKKKTTPPRVVERHLGHRIEPKVFHGRDRKFIEVRGDEWETRVLPCEDGTVRSIFSFTNQLDLILKGRYTDQDSHDWSEVWETGCPALGILTCVPT